MKDVRQAAMIVVKTKAAGNYTSDRIFDLRVDDGDDNEVNGTAYQSPLIVHDHGNHQ